MDTWFLICIIVANSIISICLIRPRIKDNSTIYWTAALWYEYHSDNKAFKVISIIIAIPLCFLGIGIFGGDVFFWLIPFFLKTWPRDPLSILVYYSDFLIVVCALASFYEYYALDSGIFERKQRDIEKIKNKYKKNAKKKYRVL